MVENFNAVLDHGEMLLKIPNMKVVLSVQVFQRGVGHQPIGRQPIVHFGNGEGIVEYFTEYLERLSKSGLVWKFQKNILKEFKK